MGHFWVPFLDANMSLKKSMKVLGPTPKNNKNDTSPHERSLFLKLTLWGVLWHHHPKPDWTRGAAACLGGVELSLDCLFISLWQSCRFFLKKMWRVAGRRIHGSSSCSFGGGSGKRWWGVDHGTQLPTSSPFCHFTVSPSAMHGMAGRFRRCAAGYMGGNDPVLTDFAWENVLGWEKGGISPDTVSCCLRSVGGGMQ